jgi:hypothetical protein
MLLAQQEADCDGSQGSRNGVGREHGEHNRHRERREQIARGALQEEHGDKHAADGERGDQRRHRNASSALQHRRIEWHPFFQKPVRVLDRHRAVIDQDADSQCQAAQGHRVDGLAEGGEHRD